MGLREGGVRLLYKYDGKLFRRYTRNANVRVMTKCLFADDGVLVSSSAESAIRSCKEVSSSFGLTVSNPKTKHMVIGRLAVDSDRDKLKEGMREFLYLGSLVADSGRMDVERRIAQTSKAFGALRKAVFLDKNLTLTTKRKVYQACALSVLLYGSECWTPLRKHINKLNSFH